ncbi:MAG: hypothetical protein PF637_13425 [Spirochaetes bacterium]|jgi:hypothetical protein|nr:hypothetical protein [Spirochaetota bacterium]
MKNMNTKLIVCLLFITLISGCTSIPQSGNVAGTGIHVEGTHGISQIFLNFTEGITIQFDNGKAETLAWNQSKYYTLSPGSHTYSIYFKYMGKSGKTKGTFSISKGQKLFLRYKTPLVVMNSGNVKIIDIETKESIGH